MSGTVVSVAPGRNVPTQLSGAPYESGATIYNNDTQLSVWISDTPSTAINNGFELGPLGSVLWRSKRAPWAIVGNDLLGVLGTSPVLLTISDNIREPVNPVSAAISIAEAGIPTSVRTEVITDWSSILLSGQETAYIDVSSWSSLTINVFSQNPIKTGVLLTEAIQNPKFGTIQIMTSHGFASSGGIQFTYQMPLSGTLLKMLNNQESLQQVSVIAMLSTRSVAQARFIPVDRVGQPPLLTDIVDRRANLATTSPLQPFDAPIYTNGGTFNFRLYLVGVASTRYYVGLERMNVSLTALTTDVVSPIAVTTDGTGNFEQWYSFAAIPAGVYRFTLLGPPAAAFIDIQAWFSEGSTEY